MAPRVRLSETVVVTTAVEIVDRDGFEALTLSQVAEALGVGPSALYSHVDGLGGLRRVVAVESLRRLTADVRDAAIGTAGDAALHAVAIAYREHSHRHPGRFVATLRASADELGSADEELHGVFVLLHRAAGASDRDAATFARSVRSAIHGFLVLEHSADERHPDTDFHHLITTLCRGLR